VFAVSRLVPLAALTLAAALPLASQANPAPRVLRTAEATFEEPFDQVVALRELPGGRVLVTDVGAKALYLADFKSGRQITIGRNGQGPGEYQFPGELLALPGDTTLLTDRVGRRFLVVLPDGKLGATIPYPEKIGGFPEPRGADRQGRIYFQGSPFRGGPGGGGVDTEAVPDSTAILRWDRARNTVDTVGRVKLPASKMNVSGTQNARVVMMRPQPFAEQDDWAVGMDGLVGVVRVADYHVEWLGGPSKVSGPPVRHERLKITEADKQRFVSMMRNTRNRITVTNGGPGRGSQDIRPPEVNAADLDWPEAKPPFTGRGSWVSPEGQLWVQRSTTVRDSTPVYDVFDRSGSLKERIHLPTGRRLVGLGQGTLYALYSDDDGLQYLERYRR
jgi:hypothetical protein